MNEIAEIMTRVENKMTLLSSSLKELEQKIDSPNDSLDGSMPSDMKFDADISGDVREFGKAMKKLQLARQEIYRYAMVQKRAVKFDGLEVTQQLADIVTGLHQDATHLIEQCEYLEQTRKNLDVVNEESVLIKTLNEFEDKLSTLGTYDEKIRDAADAAAENVKDMQSAIDTRMYDAIKLEKELLIASRDLRQAAQDLLGSQNSAAPKEEEPPPPKPEVPTPKVDDPKTAALIQKIISIIYDEENLAVFKRMIAIQLTEDEKQMLTPELRKKFLDSIQGFNHYLKIYSGIKKILDKSGGN